MIQTIALITDKGQLHLFNSSFRINIPGPVNWAIDRTINQKIS